MGDAKLSRPLPAENGEPRLAPLIPERLAKGEALLAPPNVNLGMMIDAVGCDTGAPKPVANGGIDGLAEGAKILL